MLLHIWHGHARIFLGLYVSMRALCSYLRVYMEAAPIRINFEIFNVARGCGSGKGWLQLLIVSVLYLL